MLLALLLLHPVRPFRVRGKWTFTNVCVEGVINAGVRARVAKTAKVGEHDTKEQQQR